MKFSRLFFAHALSMLGACAVMAGGVVFPGVAGAAVKPAKPAAADSLLGADTNRNGVRDDLEPYLAAHFSKDERVLRSVSNTIISFQYAVKASNVAESSKAHSMNIRSQECLASLGPALLPYKDALEKLEPLMVNTPQRKQAYQAHAARLAEVTFAVRNEPEWDDSCLKRVDAQ